MNRGMATWVSQGSGQRLPQALQRSAAVCSRHARVSSIAPARQQRPSLVRCQSIDAAGQPFTITTPLYYVNAAPHMGSAYPTIAADVLARYHRLTGRKVRYVTGTDEHGEKIALAAAAQGMSPQQHCDSIVEQYKALWSQLDISYDSFIRTTAPQHESLVAEVLQKVWDKGDIYKAAYSGWYCVDCEEYKDEKELLMDDSNPEQSHKCPIHRKPCQHRSEENYFFALSKYQQQLQELIENTDFVQVCWGWGARAGGIADEEHILCAGGWVGKGWMAQLIKNTDSVQVGGWGVRGKGGIEVNGWRRRAHLSVQP